MSNRLIQNLKIRLTRCIVWGIENSVFLQIKFFGHSAPGKHNQIKIKYDK